MLTAKPMEKLQDQFVKRVQDNTNRIAVCYDDGFKVTCLTYQQTYSLSCKVTEFLRSIYVRNAVIGYFGPTNALIPSLFIGILESYAAFAVIDKNAPAVYNLCLIQKLGMKYVIAEPSFYQRHLDRLGACKIKKQDSIYLGDDEFYLLVILDVDCLYHTLQENRHLAYAIQTSGTTGHPKLVKVPHSCIVPNITDFCNLFAVSPEDAILLSAPLTFDPSIVEIFTALSRGATLIMIPDILKAIPQKFVEMIFERHKATIIQATPSLFRRIGAEILAKTLLSASSSLRVLAFGGERCPTVATLCSWKDDSNQTVFYNVYGITEVSSWATIHRIDLTGGSELDDSIPLGQPLSLTICEVWDDDGKLVVEGEGQLYIGGSQRICLIDDEDPNCLNQKTMRATGDGVRCHPDGLLQFLGRHDDTFKRNGKKCTLSSVEKAAAMIVQDSSCCCVYEKDLEKLWLFVALTPDVKSLVMENIHDRLATMLPKHCLPDEVFAVPVLPVTSHGKVDKGALVCHATSQRLSLGLVSDVEAIRCAFLTGWRKISPQVSNDDNFILQGGDSFSAVSLSESMTLLTGHPLPLLTEKLLQQTFVNVWEYIVNCISSSNICNQKCIITQNTHEEHDSKDGKAGLYKRLADDMNINSHQSVKKRQRSAISNIMSQTEVLIVQRAKPVFDVHCDECITITRPWLSIRDDKGKWTLRMKWKYNLNKCVDASPTVIVQCRNEMNSVVYVGSHSHRMAAVELASGRELWITNLKGRIESSAAASSSGEFIIVGCYDHKIYCLNTCDGTVRWQFSTDGEVKSSPCFVSELGLVYVGSHDHHLYAIDVVHGTCKWMLQPGSGSIFSSPCYCKTSGNLYVATLDGIFCAVNPGTGIIRWKLNCGRPIFSSPATSSTAVCFGCVDSLIHCYSDVGQKKWQFSTKAPIFSSPCIFRCSNHNEELVLCGSHDHFIYCLRFDCGTLLWKLEMDAQIYASAFAFQVCASDHREKHSNSTDISQLQVANMLNSTGQVFMCKLSPMCGAAALVTTKGLLKLVNINSGRTMAAYQFAGQVFSSPVVVGQSLVVGCRDKFLYCLSLQTG